MKHLLHDTILQFNAKAGILDSAIDHIQHPFANIFNVTLARVASRYVMPVKNFLDSRVIKVGLAVNDYETCLVSHPNFKQRSNNREKSAKQLHLRNVLLKR